MTHSKDFVVGLDLGTSSYKAAAFDRDGRMVAEAAAAPTHAHPRPGWVDQDPADLLATAALAVRRLIEGGIDPSRVGALGLTGQLGGIVLIDDDAQAVGLHEVWLDNRCQPYRDGLLKEHGVEVLSLTGIQPFQAPRLRWRLAERPEEYARGTKAVQCWPFVGMTFAGLGSADAYNDWTSIGIFGVADLQAAAWSDRLCSLAEIDAALLPRIVPPWEIVGELTGAWANKTGLCPGTPIVAGLGDGIAGWLGCGAVKSGIIVDTVGSSDHFGIATDHFAADPDHNVLTGFRSAVPGVWHVFGYTAGSGLSHQWFLREFAADYREPSAIPPRAWDAFESTAAEISPGSDGLLCIPHLEGRFCPDEPDVRGTWIGFTWQHTRTHFYRSILESVAYEYAHYLQAAARLGVAPSGEGQEVRVVGGGAKSGLWNQIKADVLNMTYSELAPSNYTCRGAALCAGFGSGLYADLTETAMTEIDVVRRFAPDPHAHQRYRPYVEHYQATLNELRPAFNRAARLV